MKNDYELDLFMETSAKTGMNTQKLFAEAAKLLFKDYYTYKVEKTKKEGENLKVENINKSHKKKRCCWLKIKIKDNYIYKVINGLNFNIIYIYNFITLRNY